jgi:hypothetical protein
MKITCMKWLLAALVFGMPWFGANALLPADPALYSFTITQGKVTITPVFCIPELCQEQSGEFTGTFNAAIRGDQIRLSEIQMKSELDFTLPEDPQTDRNGAVYDAKFYFNGTELVLEGIINSSAFDGPIVNYSLTAQLSVKPPVGFDQNGYYLARQDFRKCAAPMCGGIYVKHVNNRVMRCPNGRASTECYIGTPDWSKLGFYPFANLPSIDSAIVLKGVIDHKVRLGRFVAESAFSPAGKKSPSGTFYGVENNGIVCITSPCFSFDQYTLNSKTRVSKISDLDLTRAGASEEDMQTAYALMAEGETVLIAGVNQRARQMAGVGIKLLASQFYLPIKAEIPKACEDGYKPTDKGCMTANGCVYPQLELAAYSGVRPIEGEDPVINYSCVHTCDLPGVLVSNGYCNLYLP